MKRIFIAAVLTTAAAFCVQAQGRGNRGNLTNGGVFVMTNQVDNAVMAFVRNPGNGRLTLIDTELTQGAGTPISIPPDPPVDALASQGSLGLDEDNEYLYAVNAGSNEITTLEITPRGLEFVGIVPSGGIRPISLTSRNEILYVLNEGGEPNITGFNVAEDGSLTPIADSTQPLIGGMNADPAEVSFNEDGTFLFVSEKMGNRIDVYPVNASGVAGPPTAMPSSGLTPFGFAFGRDGNLFVSEAMAGMPGAGALSSYSVDNDGVLTTVTGSLGNGQTASCWVVTEGRLVFVSNTASGTISSYAANSDGELTRLNTIAAITGMDSAPIDMALSRHGSGEREGGRNGFLYVIESGDHTIGAFSTFRRGRGLMSAGEFGTLPPGSQGIVAF